MPICIPDKLPAKKILENENVFVIGKHAALRQDIRAMKIAIVNLMPLKIETETQLLRMLSNSPLQVEIELVRTKSHTSKNTPQQHLDVFYKTFDEIKHTSFDGLIITGAPVEHMSFEEVDYWEELQTIMQWANETIPTTLYICWAAQAGLYYHYGINKYPVEKKIFGVFPHYVVDKTCLLTRGFDEQFLAPHSRHTEIRKDDIQKIPNLTVVSLSEEAGVYIVSSRDGRQVFVTGHSEYDLHTLRTEYERDRNKGLRIEIPKNYFPNDNPVHSPKINWRSHAFLLYSNWLNYYVYQPASDYAPIA